MKTLVWNRIPEVTDRPVVPVGAWLEASCLLEDVPSLKDAQPLVQILILPENQSGNILIELRNQWNGAFHMSYGCSAWSRQDDKTAARRHTAHEWTASLRKSGSEDTNFPQRARLLNPQLAQVNLSPCDSKC